MYKLFLVPSTQDRRERLIALIASIRMHKPGWLVCCVLQGVRDVKGIEADDVLILPDKVGAFRARAAGMKRWAADVYCGLDDDMLITEKSRFEGAFEMLRRSSTGIISCNWRKTEAQMSEVTLSSRFIKQPIVYTGGGYLFTQKIADLMIGNEDDYLFDNVEWSLRSYLAGYENYRFLGACSIHVGCSRGGRRAWVAERQRVLNDERYVVTQRGLRQYAAGHCEYLIPSSRGLTAEARRIHREKSLYV